MLTATQIHDLVEADAAGPRLLESAVAGISEEARQGLDAGRTV